ncbi:uncharacterized protein BX664DRAFT_389400 [Halteromyces radiatus]|uniref:uncharacterized protein n=1 Tax=Halteromyces radiatus TaxID=101107 RepID=UPI0022203897|nr:uncharacterized protein BX664DRAFT_389400 [Halteromyces radiatus]KAI8077807.1 hypothetical protein BX664DRAFT_389400 [Halteromyces radiatus]
MLKRTLTTAATSKPFRLAVVGSGPAGFYTSHKLLKESPTTQIDMFDSLPVPHGLVRYGVAPDHPEVKNVMTTFDKVAEDERFRFFGNVTIGKQNDDNISKSIAVHELQRYYDAILFSYGASEDRQLGIPNEDVYGSSSARTFVGWYNGLPRDRDLKLPLEDTDTAVVIGQGNVALDVARVLLSPIDELRKTDMTEYALEALSKSRIKHVHVVGRRGPLQAAFTAKELREQLKLPGVQFRADHTWIHDQIQQHSDYLAKRRPLKRLMALLDQEQNKQGDKSWHLQFLRSPVEILTNNDRVAGIRYEINRLEGPVEKSRAVGTGEYETQECGLVLRSIGYKSLAMDGLPFDVQQGLIPNLYGKMIDHEQNEMPGMYTAGWLKRGPTGVIVSTMSDAYETADTILADLRKDAPMLSSQNHADDDLFQLMYQRQIRHVSYDDWKRIEAAEFQAGAKLGKPREKFTTVEHMLDVLNR